MAKIHNTKHILRSTVRQIRLRTWVGLGLIFVLLPMIVFGVVYKDSILAALSGSDANPAAHWAFDEGTANTCSGGANDACDNSGSGNDGAFGATTAAPTIRTEDVCVSGKCLFFDGSDDTVTVANTVASVQSITFWVKVMSTSTTEQILALNGSDTFSSVSGTLTVAGFGTDTIYVDGKPATTLTASKWHHVAVTSTTSFSASAITMGNISTNFGNIFLDEVKLFTAQLNVAQVKAEYAGGAAVFADKNAFLNDGLVGYWPMDETAANSCTGGSNDNCDKSGNGFDLTWSASTNDPSLTGGKFGNTTFFDGNDQAVTASSLPTITNSITYAAWVYPTSLGGFQAITTSTDTPYPEFAISSSNPTIYNATDGELNFTDYTFTTNTWQHMVASVNNNVVTMYVNGNQIGTPQPFTAGANTSTMYVAHSGGSEYFTGNIDELRVYNRALSSTEVKSLYNWAPGPTLHWKFDENTGTSTTNDSSGNSFTGTLNSITSSQWAPGVFGSAIDFTGTPDDVHTSSTTVIDTSLPYTLEAWINPDTWGGSSAGEIIAKDDVVHLFIDDANNNLEMCLQGSCGSTFARSGDNTISLGVWQHVAAVHDGSGNFKMYVNGIDQTSDSTGPDSNLADEIIVGGDNINGSAFAFDGKIDDVRIYNYDRTSQQIVEDMNGGHPTGGSPIGSQVAYWAMDEQYGTTINNSASATFTTAISGATWRTKENCKVNGCLDFDGTDDVTTITNATAIDLNNNLVNGFTFSAWVNPDTVGEGSAGQIFVKSSTTNCALGGSTPFNITCSVDLGTDATVTVNSAIPASTWTHIAVSYTDDSDDEITLWINGKPRGSSTNGVGPTSAESSNLLIGGGTANNFDGKIDEFKIYSSELTADQIKVDYSFGGSINFGTGAVEETQDIGAGNPPVAYWDMNEGSWTVDCSTDTVFDKSGNNYHGDACPNSTGPAGGVTGKIGKAGNFDGAGDYVSVPVGSFSVYAGTVSMWLTNVQNWADLTVIQSPFSTAQDGNGDLFNIEMTDTETLKVQFWDGYSANLRSVTVTPVGGWPLANTWHHLEVTWSGSLDNLSNAKFYLDGVALTMSADTTISTDAIGTTLNIGGNNPIGDREDWAGKIDDVKIYNYARSAAQVAYDYNGGGPVAWWQFDECSGTTANNNGSLGTALNGTITPQSNENAAVGDCTTSATTMWYNGRVGKFNSGLDFDGNDDYIALTDTTSTDFASTNTPFSVSAWVIPEEANGDSQRIIHKTEAVAPATIYNWNLLWSGEQTVNTDRTFVFTLQRDSTFYDAEGPAELAVDQWYHLVGVWNGTSSTLYINGKPYTNDGSGTYGGRNDGTFQIGSGVTTPGHSDFFNGKIDDVRLYNYALSAAQVKKLMNNDAGARFGPTTGTP